MRTITARLTLILSVFILTGSSFLQCNSSDKTLKNSSKSLNEYFPLKDGLTWQYINEAPRDESVIINVSCKSKNVNGEFELDKYPFFGNLNNSDRKTQVNIDDSGNVIVKNNEGLNSILLPGKSKWGEGYSWKYTDMLNAYLTPSVQQKVKTENGEYDCIYISFTDGFTFSFEMWLAKGTGIVKWGANRTNPPNPHPAYYVLKEITGN